MGTEDRGFASMDEDKQREIASKGGKASGSSNTDHGKMSRSEAGKKGAAAQPTEAKAKGGHNSHSNQ